jgi:hypothetical protein
MESALSETREAPVHEFMGLDNLHLVARILTKQSGMAPADDTAELAAQLIQGMDGACKAAKDSRKAAEDVRKEAEDAQLLGVHRAFAIARSHYTNIDLGAVCQGFLADYTDAELDAIEEEVTPFARTLADKMREENVGNQ